MKNLFPCYTSPLIEIMEISFEGAVLASSDGLNVGIYDWETGEDDGGSAY